MNVLASIVFAPANFNTKGRDLLWWLEFTKLVGITVHGKTPQMEAAQNGGNTTHPFGDPIDNESKLIIPLNKQSTTTSTNNIDN